MGGEARGEGAYYIDNPMKIYVNIHTGGRGGGGHGESTALLSMVLV